MLVIIGIRGVEDADDEGGWRGILFGVCRVCTADKSLIARHAAAMYSVDPFYKSTTTDVKFSRIDIGSFRTVLYVR